MLSDEAKTRLVEEVGAFKLRKGDYEEAAEVYEQLLSGDVALEAEERLKAVAHLVIASSWFDHEAAEEHAMSLPALENMDDLDPEELESTDVPRSSRARRLVVVDRAMQRLDRKKAGVDPVKRLEKRARLREKYLKKLQEEGKYDPKKPTTPDAERWVAKKSRSYNKRSTSLDTACLPSLPCALPSLPAYLLDLFVAHSFLESDNQSVCRLHVLPAHSLPIPPFPPSI